MRLVLLLVVLGSGLIDCYEEDLEWWKSTVFYQIYPRSFKDSDGDGVGDLRGITEMVPYLKELGVGAVWLSPIYPSPGKDFGYDISNYTAIDPLFGTMEDFDNLTRTLENAGIKIIMDFVPNHSSDQHQWFKDSVNQVGDYDDFYVWAGTMDHPPTNWLSNFDGPAWEYVEERGQYYLHQFLKEQPDLNYRNPAVQQAILESLMFWLNKGVSGFRMDAVYTIWETCLLDEYLLPNCNNASSYGCYNHTYTADQDGTYKILKKFRDLLDSYTRSSGVPRVMMTESYTHDWSKVRQYYNYDGDNIANFPFNFMLIMDVKKDSTAKEWVDIINNWYNNTEDIGWPNWVIGNHDQNRAASRWGTEMVDGVNMMMLLLKGTAVTYNGDELGMEDSFVRWDQAKDPQGIRAGPDGFKYRSRDPQRGPFLWNATNNAGFTNASKPWLPVHSSYWRSNAEMQRKNNQSHFSIYKNMVKLRQTYLWKFGKTEVNALNGTVVGVFRYLEDNPSLMTLVNVGMEEVTLNLLSDRPSLPRQVYVYTASPNLNYKFGEPVNVAEVVLPPKASVTFLSQSLNIEMKINSTHSIIPSKLIH